MATVHDLSLRGALGIAFRTGWSGLRDAAKFAPGWLIATAVLFGMQAAIPAAEVCSE